MPIAIGIFAAIVLVNAGIAALLRVLNKRQISNKKIMKNRSLK